MSFRRQVVALLSLAGAICAGSCSKSSTTPSQILTLTKVAGDSQVASAGAALGATLTVNVKDQNGTPVAGAMVSWSVGAGGGSVGGPTSSTDAGGNASISRTLGPSAGFQTTTASIGGATGSPITFTSISQINGAFQVAAVPGAALIDTVLATLSTPYQFLVSDHTGAPVAGVIVSFAVTAGGGNLSATSDTTDVAGHVTTTLTFPSTAGIKTVQATVTGLVGSPVSVFGTATAGHATTLALSSGDHQAGPVSSPLAAPLAVVVHDGHGNLAPNVTVTWAVSGGGSVSAPTSQTSVTGVASVIRTLGGSAGVGHDTATAAGLAGSPVIFSDTAAAVTDISVKDDFFTPQHDTVAVGSFARFTWAGTIGHSVTWDGAPDALPAGTGVQVSGTLVVRLSSTGKYSYHCLVHGSPGSGMFGDIVTQ